jgi:Protein of unknown function (DUF4240)
MEVKPNVNSFWNIIDSVPADIKNYDLDHYEEYETFLLDLLDGAKLEVLSNFQLALTYLSSQLHTTKILYSGSLLDCNAVSFPMTDDGFDHFRLWVISRGQKVFHEILINPDDLAHLVDNSELQIEMEFEGLSYIAGQLVEKNLPNQLADFESLNTHFPDARIDDWTGKGRGFFEDQFPQISHKFSSNLDKFLE